MSISLKAYAEVSKWYIPTWQPPSTYSSIHPSSFEPWLNSRLKRRIVSPSCEAALWWQCFSSLFALLLSHLYRNVKNCRLCAIAHVWFTPIHTIPRPTAPCRGMWRGGGWGGDNLCFKRQHRKITCCWISACFSRIPPLIFGSVIMKNGGKKEDFKIYQRLPPARLPWRQ